MEDVIATVFLKSVPHVFGTGLRYSLSVPSKTSLTLKLHSKAVRSGGLAATRLRRRRSSPVLFSGVVPVNGLLEVSPS
jgi:hypothetical protein